MFFLNILIIFAIKIDNFATTIPVPLVTGFVVQGHKWWLHEAFTMEVIGANLGFICYA